MQRRGHRPHHEIADEDGEDEDRQPEHEGIDGLCNMIHGGSPKAVYLGWKFGWMTAPSLVSAVAFTSSSSQLTASALLHHGLDEVEQIARIKAGSRLRDAARDVGV